jgi:hypothetical protein
MLSYSLFEELERRQPQEEISPADFAGEITRLALGIQQFPYEGLRSVPFNLPSREGEEKQEAYYRASDEAIHALLALMPDNKILSYIKNNPSLLEENVMLQLADALISFRAHVQLAEDNYFEKIKESGRPKVELDNHANWVVHFHFIIEKYKNLLPHIPMNQYGRFMKSFQETSERVYQWILQNRPELTEQYNVLKSKINHSRNQSKRRSHHVGDAASAAATPDEAAFLKRNKRS